MKERHAETCHLHGPKRFGPFLPVFELRILSLVDLPVSCFRQQMLSLRFAACCLLRSYIHHMFCYSIIARQATDRPVHIAAKRSFTAAQFSWPSRSWPFTFLLTWTGQFTSFAGIRRQALALLKINRRSICCERSRLRFADDVMLSRSPRKLRWVRSEPCNKAMQM